jgi:hypothetical protein
VTEIAFDKDYSLAKLESEVATFEAINGPLQKLDHTDDASIAVYENDMAPDKPIKLVPKAGDAIPDGFKKVAEGTVWVIGVLQEVVAIRES